MGLILYSIAPSTIRPLLRLLYSFFFTLFPLVMCVCVFQQLSSSREQHVYKPQHYIPLFPPLRAKELDDYLKSTLSVYPPYRGLNSLARKGEHAVHTLLRHLFPTIFLSIAHAYVTWRDRATHTLCVLVYTWMPARMHLYIAPSRLTLLFTAYIWCLNQY